MLRATVCLNRKITRDYNSTGYSVSLDGEIPFNNDETEAIQDRISELFHLAEEALNIEIDRDQGTDAIGRRDEEPQRPQPQADQNRSQAPGPRTNGNGQSQSNGNGEAATNKQCQYLLTLGKRANLSNQDIDAKINQVIGRAVGVYQLTKKEAGLVIDALSKNGQPTYANGRR